MASEQEIQMIIKVNAKLHYNKKDDVKKIYSFAVHKNIFKGELGKKYMARLKGILESGQSGTDCVLCGGELANLQQSLICPACLRKHQVVQVQKKPDEIKQTSVRSGLDMVTSKINEMAGEKGAVDLKLRDLFSHVFKKHSREEGEEIFIAGTLRTTPDESEIAVSWPKPWLFSRVFLILIASYILLYICASEFGNPNVLPGLMFVGALAMPFSVLMFFFETNAPRNISLFEVVKLFFFGGTASLVITLILFEAYPVGELDYTGAIMVGIIEELGKLLAVAIFVKRMNSKYILNGMLIGAAIGVGFAVFESAGYAFRFFIAYNYSLDAMTDVLFMRGWSSLGGHVVWAAISGAGLIMAKGDSAFRYKQLFDKKCMTFFLIPAILHAVWDCPLMDETDTKFLILIALAWIVILVMLSVGLKQIERYSLKRP